MRKSCRRRAGLPRRAAGRTARATIFAVLAALAMAGLSRPAAAAPAWSLEDPSGRRVAFADELARGPVVVAFWATWCKPCLQELPRLEELALAYGDRVSFLAVSTDDSRSIAKVEPLVRARGWQALKVLLDPGAEVQRLLQVETMPHLVLYDVDGREAYRHTGYVAGDEARLQAEIERLLAPGATTTTTGPGRAPASDEVSFSDRFEYSYATGTRREIVENWLDATWRGRSMSAGLTLNSQAPGEELRRRNEVTHRWFEVEQDGLRLRAGHFHGLFGRGLVFNAWQDRNLRIDTRLDGVTATLRRGAFAATVVSGSPSARDLDLRGADLEWSPSRGPALGFSGLTWHNSAVEGAGPVDREWAAAFRARQSLARADWYAEAGGRNRFTLDGLGGNDDGGERDGWALYGNLNLYGGPFTLSWEGSDYRRFELVSQADSVTSLNRPPALARESTWTLPNRAPHVLNASDEKGHNLDIAWRAGDDLTVHAGASRIRLHDGTTVYESASLAIEGLRWRGARLGAHAGFQDSEGLRQTLAAEARWAGPGGTSWQAQAEHQHVRMGGGAGFDLGAFDQQWLKLECALPGRWTVGAVAEANNKYADQRSPREEPGPFLAAQVTRSLARGGTVAMWAGERQEGFLCSGGVCKYEPAFSGVELTGTLRW